MTLRPPVLMTAIGLFVMPLFSLAAQETTAPAAPANADDNQRFNQLITEAQQFQSESKLLDAMEKINEAEKLKPDTAILHNMRGSIYTAMRDFEKAKVQFEKARELQPGAFEPRFNLTELSYVRGEYKEAEQGFRQMLEEYPKLRVEIRHITLFKILVCQLKQDNLAGAEETMKNFTFMDDTPAYYYARASFAFQQGNKMEGHTWTNKAAQIFKRAEQTVPYVDSLIEARWIDSLGIPDDFKQ